MHNAPSKGLLMMVMPPEIETNRLRLSQWRDFGMYAIAGRLGSHLGGEVTMPTGKPALAWHRPAPEALR
jgi:hypothetical protein